MLSDSYRQTQIGAELEEIRTVRRPALAENIRQLNGFGGFSETEMDDFVNEQSQIDAHVKEIELHACAMPSSSRMAAAPAIRWALGSHVTVRDGGGEEIHWTIVSSAEASSRQGKISNESLVGASLMGHAPGEIVTVQAPGGLQEFTILKIE